MEGAIYFFFFKTKLFFLQILAAMQKELAASGLSPEEILAKTLLLQVPSESDEDDDDDGVGGDGDADGGDDSYHRQ